MHVCSQQAPAPHVGGPIVIGASTVLVGYLPAARQSDVCVCAAGPPDIVVAGAPTVLIEFLPAARQGDPTAHGGVIVTGCPTVLIGASGQGAALKTSKPFCEECEPKVAPEQEDDASG